MDDRKMSEVLDGIERTRNWSASAVVVALVLTLAFVDIGTGASVSLIFVAAALIVAIIVLAQHLTNRVREVGEVEAAKSKVEADEPEPLYPGAIMTIPPMRKIDPETKTVNVHVAGDEE